MGSSWFVLSLQSPSKAVCGVNAGKIKLFSKKDFIPQTATWTPFSTSIPATSHLVVFGFNPEKSENNFNFSERWTMEFSSFKKKVVSSA